MTEKEWLECTDPKPMLRFLLGTNYPRVQDVDAFRDCKPSDRKLRLFACACYYRIRHLIPNDLVQAGVEVAERFAEGMVTEEALQLATTKKESQREFGCSLRRAFSRPQSWPRHIFSLKRQHQPRMNG